MRRMKPGTAKGLSIAFIAATVLVLPLGIYEITHGEFFGWLYVVMAVAYLTTGILYGAMVKRLRNPDH